MTTVAPAGRRPRWAWWLLVVVLLTPVVELLVILWVADLIGVLVVPLLMLGVVLGVLVLRRGGASSLRRIREVARTGRPPTREVVDGALTVLGGILLILPGFLTDVLALACLVPPLRTGARALVGWLLARAVTRTTQRVRGARGQVVPGSVVDETAGDATVVGDAAADGGVLEGRVLPPDDDRPRPGG